MMRRCEIQLVVYRPAGASGNGSWPIAKLGTLLFHGSQDQIGLVYQVVCTDEYTLISENKNKIDLHINFIKLKAQYNFKLVGRTTIYLHFVLHSYHMPLQMTNCIYTAMKATAFCRNTFLM